MTVSKVLAVLSAILLVGAVAIATLGPQDISLGEAVAMLDRTTLPAAEAYVRNHLSAWLWERPIAAIITRPVWLMPAALGLICAGGAATASGGPATNKSRRRRS